MDIISYSLASEVEVKAKSAQITADDALSKVGQLGTKTVDETLIGDTKALVYNSVTGKAEYSYGVYSGLKQISKLGVTASASAPHFTDITINNTVDFIRPKPEVLKIVNGGLDATGGSNTLKTLAAFNNADASDFNADDQVVFDGTMRLKTDYTKAMTSNGTLGSGVSFSASIIQSNYQNIESLKEDTALTGIKYLIKDGTAYKRYEPAASTVPHNFTSTERSDFDTDDKVVFDNNAKLKTSYSEAMTVDSNFTGEGSLLRKTLDKVVFKSIEKVSVI